MFDDLLRDNVQYASTFTLKGIPPRAAKRFGLVTCMDTRIEPLAMLGLVPGDAKILRNAGGRVTDDVLRSLILATHLLDVNRIAVMQHTNCALAGRDDAQVLASLIEAGGEEVSDAGSWEFLAMPDPDDALQRDVDRVRSCALLPPGIPVEGWRYDVETGAIHRVITTA